MERKKNFIINVVYYSLVLLLMYVFIKYVFILVLPIALAFLLAALINNLSARASRKLKLKTKPLSIILLTLMYLLLGGLITGLIYIIGHQISALQDEIPVLIQNIPSLTEHVSNTLSEFLPSDVYAYTISLLSTVGQSIKNGILSFSAGVVSSAAGTAMGLSKFLFSFLIFIVASYLISIDYIRVKEFLLRQLPQRVIDIIRDTRAHVFRTSIGIVRAYATIMLITFMELSVGLSILGIKYAIAIAAIIALLDILPVLGTGGVLVPWAIISLLFGNLFMGIGLLVLYGVILIVRNIIEPKIVGDHIGLPPIVTLTAMFVGLRLLGFWGLICGPICVIVLKRLHESNNIRIWK